MIFRATVDTLHTRLVTEETRVTAGEMTEDRDRTGERRAGDRVETPGPPGRPASQMSQAGAGDTSLVTIRREPETEGMTETETEEMTEKEKNRKERRKKEK